jgi:hypothetical protein
MSWQKAPPAHLTRSTARYAHNGVQLCRIAAMSAQAALALATPHFEGAPRHRRLRPRRRCAAVVAAAFGQPRAADPFGAPPAPRRAPPPPSPVAVPIQRPQPSEAWAGEPPPRFPVPEALRMPGAPACTALPRLASLEEVFPGTGLADAFHSSAAFRAALRAATRRDLFRDPGRGPAAAAQMTAMGSTCVLDWRPATQQGAVCAAMDAALAAAGVRLRGAALLSGLAALCSVPESDDKAAGSLTDIAHTGRKQVNHSWHQDSGLRVTTVLLVRVLVAARCVHPM